MNNKNPEKGMANVLITAPAEEPLTVTEAKAHCRIDIADDDAYLGRLITVAREMAEEETGRAWITQTWELVLDRFPEAFRLRSPVQSIVSLKYLDPDGVECTLDPQDYLLDKDSQPGYVVPGYGKSWPDTRETANAVRLRYICGYGDHAASVPEKARQWMLMTIEHWYRNRGASTDGDALPPVLFLDRLLDPLRLVTF